MSDLLRTLNTQTLVLLHGFLGSASDWRGLTSALEGQIASLAVDLPGHGSRKQCAPEAYTMEGGAHSVGNQLQIVGCAEPVLYGYSMGGRLALHLALNTALHVPALILESTSAGLECDRDARVAADDRWADRFENDPLEDVLRDWYRQPVFAYLGAGDAFEQRVASRLDNDGSALAQSLRGMSVGRQVPLWERLRTLEIPVLLLAGEYDSKYVKAMQRMTDLCPHAEMRIVPRAGHSVYTENPEGAGEAVAAFLKQVT